MNNGIITLGFFILIIFIFPFSKLELICPPDHFKTDEYYWNYRDYNDSYEYLYGFQFNYRLGNIQYDDYWSGIIYEPKNFCYVSKRETRNDNYQHCYEPEIIIEENTIENNVNVEDDNENENNENIIKLNENENMEIEDSEYEYEENENENMEIEDSEYEYEENEYENMEIKDSEYEYEENENENENTEIEDYDIQYEENEYEYIEIEEYEEHEIENNEIEENIKYEENEENKENENIQIEENDINDNENDEDSDNENNDNNENNNNEEENETELGSCEYPDYTNPELIPIVPELLKVIDSDETNIPSEPYIKVDKKYHNHKSLYEYSCPTIDNRILIPMDENIIIGQKYVYYFNVVNPSDLTVKFKFQAYTIKTSFTTMRGNILESKSYVDKTFPLTNLIEIEPHSVLKVPFEITFNSLSQYGTLPFYKGKITSNITGQSNEEYYHSNVSSWRQNLNNYIEYSYPIYSALEIELESDNQLYISTYSMMYKRPNKDVLNYIGNNNSCDLGEVCVEGYGCNSNNCVKCNKYTCSGCLNNINNCTKCFPISKNGQWNVSETNQNITCDLNFVDITKFDISFNDKKQVPPAIHFRVTMEFWMFVASPKLIEYRFANIIYKDFMVISLMPETGENLMNVYCIPLEFIYKFPDDSILIEQVVNNFNDFINKTLEAPYLKEKIEDSASKWFYVRCAYNI